MKVSSKSFFYFCLSFALVSILVIFLMFATSDTSTEASQDIIIKSPPPVQKEVDIGEKLAISTNVTGTYGPLQVLLSEDRILSTFAIIFFTILGAQAMMVVFGRTRGGLR